jgi:hypothetical protein
MLWAWLTRWPPALAATSVSSGFNQVDLGERVEELSGGQPCLGELHRHSCSSYQRPCPSASATANDRTEALSSSSLAAVITRIPWRTRDEQLRIGDPARAVVTCRLRHPDCRPPGAAQHPLLAGGRVAQATMELHFDGVRQRFLRYLSLVDIDRVVRHWAQLGNGRDQMPPARRRAEPGVISPRQRLPTTH